MRYVILKLTNNENIVCEVNEEINKNKEYLDVYNPMRIVVFMQESGEMGMNLVPWFGPMLTLQKTFKISTSHIIAYVESVSDDLILHYEKIVEVIRKRVMSTLDGVGKSDNGDDVDVQGMKVSKEELQEALSRWDVDEETSQ